MEGAKDTLFVELREHLPPWTIGSLVKKTDQTYKMGPELIVINGVMGPKNQWPKKKQGFTGVEKSLLTTISGVVSPH